MRFSEFKIRDMLYNVIDNTGFHINKNKDLYSNIYTDYIKNMENEKENVDIDRHIEAIAKAIKDNPIIKSTDDFPLDNTLDDNAIILMEAALYLYKRPFYLDRNNCLHHKKTADYDFYFANNNGEYLASFNRFKNYLNDEYHTVGNMKALYQRAIAYEKMVGKIDEKQSTKKR